MKLAYETPKMKAELFQANQYVAACDNGHSFTGRMFVWKDNVQYWFSESSKRLMINQNSGQQQWYWVEDTRSNFYLEYSAHVTDMQNGKHAFILYKEAEKGQSGFYDGTETGTDWWGNPIYDPDGWSLIDSGIDYDTTLQVNTGTSGNNYAEAEGMRENSTTYLGIDGKAHDADGWYADTSLGLVDKFDETVEIINS